MATVSYHTHHATPRKPGAARVLQSYWHIVETQGRRGALRKTGDIYGISDETVRRYLAAHDAAHNAPETPVELQYVPPPYADELQYVPMVDESYVTPHATDESQTDTTECVNLCQATNATDAAQPQEMVLDADELPHATLDECHADELENAIVAAPRMPQHAVIPGRVPGFQLVDALTFCYEHAPLVQLLAALFVVALVALMGA